MSDRITANLPSADFDRTETFYGALGFERDYNDGHWLILRRGGLVLEFFRADIDPFQSWFSACIRVSDLAALYAAFSKAGISTGERDIPRIGPIREEPHGIRLFYVVDPDGSLLRCVDEAYLARAH